MYGMNRYLLILISDFSQMRVMKAFNDFYFKTVLFPLSLANILIIFSILSPLLLNIQSKSKISTEILAYEDSVSSSIFNSVDISSLDNFLSDYYYE